MLSLWGFLSYSGAVSDAILPSPHSVLARLVNLFISGDIFDDMAVSLQRLISGFLSAAAAGTLLGLVAGSFPRMSALIMPLNSFVRYIPATAFIGLFFLWFGLGELSKIALIFVGVFFFLLQMVADAVNSVPDEYLEVAYTLGAGRHDVLWRVLFMGALPDILIVWRVNFAAAWIFLIIAELMASRKGLGNIISAAWRYADPTTLFAVIALIGLLGVLFDMSFEGVMKLLFPWRIRQS